MTRSAGRETMWWCVSVLLLGGVVGCGGGNSAAKARSALPKHFPTTTRQEWNDAIDHIEFVENFVLDDYEAVVLLPLDTSQTPMPPRDNTYEPTKQALARSTSTIAQGINDKLKSVPVTLAPTADQPQPGKVVVLRGRITEMNPGSQSARFWVGMGAGAARATMICELADGPSGRTLLRWKDGRASTGKGVKNMGGDYGALLRQNLLELGQDTGILLSAFSPRQAATKKK